MALNKLSKGDKIHVQYDTVGIYGRGKSKTHEAATVVKVNGSSKPNNGLNSELIYRTDLGETYRLEGRVNHLYTCEEDKREYIEGVNVSINVA